MTTAAAPPALDKLLAEFARRRPFRTGSLIVTVFGDAIAPRGGTLWLGSLLEVMALFDIESGLVRTALSRLVQDGWFERSRIGKHSFYRLSSRGSAEFAEATRRIYHAQEAAWTGGITLALLAAVAPGARNEVRDRLASAGFGQYAPTVMLRPATGERPPPPVVPGLVCLEAEAGAAAHVAQTLAAGAWDLDAVGGGYTRFLEAFSGLEAGKGLRQLDGAHAFMLRILLVHEYRRILLRDPLLPRAMLPEAWPGFAARALCRRLYGQIAGPAERWLDAHARAADGPLPAADDEFRTRFAEFA